MAVILPTLQTNPDNNNRSASLHLIIDCQGQHTRTYIPFVLSQDGEELLVLVARRRLAGELAPHGQHELDGVVEAR